MRARLNEAPNRAATPAPVCVLFPARLDASPFATAQLPLAAGRLGTCPALAFWRRRSQPVAQPYPNARPAGLFQQGPVPR